MGPEILAILSRQNISLDVSPKMVSTNNVDTLRYGCFLNHPHIAKGIYMGKNKVLKQSVYKPLHKVEGKFNKD